MSGHSKWSTIKRQKEVNDAKRGQMFTKVANAITIATRLGGSGNLESNPRLRVALDSARKINMPKDNVQRAIDRGLGNLPGQILEEVLYEGFGPSKVAFIVEGVTDNKLRTNQEVRNIFERAGGSLGSNGSVTYMFDRVGEIKVKTKGGTLEDEVLELIDLGAIDVEDFVDEDGVQKYFIYTDSDQLNQVSNKIAQSRFEVEESGLVYKPNVSVTVSDPVEANKLLEFSERLEDLADAQKVYANFDIPEGLI